MNIDFGKLGIPEEYRAEFADLIANTVDVLPFKEFADKFVKAKREGRPLRIKLGADPSAPDLHLGHSVALRKLRTFQKYGHTVVFIIGDYTARIGDPSGKNLMRPRLSKEQVDANAETYLRQVMMILDPEKTEVRHNCEWLEPLTVSDTIDLMGKYTVSQMMERDDFNKRFDNEVPIYLHEFIYPLLQGYDSIAVKADIELGGTDQKFNLLVGRELQRLSGMEEQCIMTMPLLIGLDGVQKMSKSLGNYIGISENPTSIFGKSMSIPDDNMWDYFLLAADMPEDEVDRLRDAFESGAKHPRAIKEELGKRLVALYHGDAAADAAAADFRAKFTDRSFPEETATKLDLKLTDVPTFQKLVIACGAAKSAREAQRFIEQRSFSVFEEPDDKPITSHDDSDAFVLARTALTAGTYKLKLGKTRFVNVTLS